MLRGSALAKMDDKGRLKLPASFRALLEPRYGKEFFVTSLRGDSVRIYPLPVWREIEERLARAPSLHPPVMRFKKAVHYYGQEVSMDTQGRLLIPPLLREEAKIDGEVTVLGLQNYLEVWNRAAFVKQLREDPLTDEDLKALAEWGI